MVALAPSLELHDPELERRGPYTIVDRIMRSNAVIAAVLSERALRPFGLTAVDYGILAQLRRAAPSHELAPKVLATAQGVTAGGMTRMLDRLERQLLIERVPNPCDRRGPRVRLTPSGRDIVDTAAAARAEVVHDVVSVLAGDEQGQLEALLGTLLARLDRN